MSLRNDGVAGFVAEARFLSAKFASGACVLGCTRLCLWIIFRIPSRISFGPSFWAFFRLRVAVRIDAERWPIGEINNSRADDFGKTPYQDAMVASSTAFASPDRMGRR